VNYPPEFPARKGAEALVGRGLVPEPISTLPHDPPSSATWVAWHGYRLLFTRAMIAFLSIALLCAASTLREFDISIRDRRVEGSASTLRIKRGDTVLLRWRSDETVAVHLHGYDLQANVFATSPATLRFDATIAGRFPITAHEFGAAAADRDARLKKHREVTLLYLEVLPE
jgi:hypothetical protein